MLVHLHPEEFGDGTVKLATEWPCGRCRHSSPLAVFHGGYGRAQPVSLAIQGEDKMAYPIFNGNKAKIAGVSMAKMMIGECNLAVEAKFLKILSRTFACCLSDICHS